MSTVDPTADTIPTSGPSTSTNPAASQKSRIALSAYLPKRNPPKDAVLVDNGIEALWKKDFNALQIISNPKEGKDRVSGVSGTRIIRPSGMSSGVHSIVAIPLIIDSTNSVKTVLSVCWRGISEQFAYESSVNDKGDLVVTSVRTEEPSSGSVVIPPPGQYDPNFLAEQQLKLKDPADWPKEIMDNYRKSAVEELPKLNTEGKTVSKPTYHGQTTISFPTLTERTRHEDQIALGLDAIKIKTGFHSEHEDVESGPTAINFAGAGCPTPGDSNHRTGTIYYVINTKKPLSMVPTEDDQASYDKKSGLPSMENDLEYKVGRVVVPLSDLDKYTSAAMKEGYGVETSLSSIAPFLSVLQGDAPTVLKERQAEIDRALNDESASSVKTETATEG